MWYFEWHRRQSPLGISLVKTSDKGLRADSLGGEGGRGAELNLNSLRLGRLGGIVYIQF